MLSNFIYKIFLTKDFYKQTDDKESVKIVEEAPLDLFL